MTFLSQLKFQVRGYYLKWGPKIHLANASYFVCFNCRDLVIKLGLLLKKKVDTWETSRNGLSCYSSTSSGCCCSPLTTPMKKCNKKPAARQRINCPKSILVRLWLIFLLLCCTEMEFPYPPPLTHIFWILKENLIANFCHWSNLHAMSLSA